MKELSIEEKAKRYDEAIKVANKYKDTHIMFPQIKDEIFPELAESEDEKIRKTIIRFFKDQYSNETEMYDGSVTVGKAVAWLEKQGEQKRQMTLVKSVLTDFKDRLGTFMQYTSVDLEKEENKQLLNEAAEELLQLADKIEPKFKKEEDERMRNAAINACKYMVDNFENSTKQYEDAINWLKSLKGRVQSLSQPKEWSEEDEERVKETLAIIETVEDINKAKDGFLGAKMWLKSLKDRIGGIK